MYLFNQNCSFCMEVQPEVIQAISKSCDVELSVKLSREEILNWLKSKISEWLSGGSHQFYHTMYRLDISESKVNFALGDKQNGIDLLANLILERQVEKAISRKKFKEVQNDDIDQDMKW